MKKEWKKPVLEVLDVNETMGGTNYTSFDASWNQGDTIPTDGKGMPLIGS
ncbi:paeninodin family lasso peptide [Niallia sp. XMNu-256]